MDAVEAKLRALLRPYARCITLATRKGGTMTRFVPGGPQAGDTPLEDEMDGPATCVLCDAVVDVGNAGDWYTEPAIRALLDHAETHVQEDRDGH